MKIPVPKVVKGLQKDVENITITSDNKNVVRNKNIINSSKLNRELKFLYNEFYNWTVRKKVHNNNSYSNSIIVNNNISNRDTNYVEEVNNRYSKEDLLYVNDLMNKIDTLYKLYRDNPKDLYKFDKEIINKEIEVLGDKALLLTEQSTVSDIFVALNHIYYSKIPSNFKDLLNINTSLFENMLNNAKKNAVNENTESISTYFTLTNNCIRVDTSNSSTSDIPLVSNGYISKLYYYSNMQNRKSVLTHDGALRLNQLLYPLLKNTPNVIDNLSNYKGLNTMHTIRDNVTTNIYDVIEGCSLTNKWTSYALQPKEMAKHITGNTYSYPSKLVTASYLYIDSLENIVHSLLNNSISFKGSNFISENANNTVTGLLNRFSLLKTPISILGEAYDDTQLVNTPLTLESKMSMNKAIYNDNIIANLHISNSHSRMLDMYKVNDADYIVASEGFVLPKYAHRMLRGGSDLRVNKDTEYTMVDNNNILSKTYLDSAYNYVDPTRANERLYIEHEYGLTSAVALFEVAANMYGIENLLSYMSKLVGTIDYINQALLSHKELYNYTLIKSIACTDPTIDKIKQDYKVATKYASKKSTSTPKYFIRRVLEDTLYTYYHSLLNLLTTYKTLDANSRAQIKDSMFIPSKLEKLPTSQAANLEYHTDLLINNLSTISNVATNNDTIHNIIWDKYITKYNKADNSIMGIIPHTLLGTQHKGAQQSVLNKQPKWLFNRGYKDFCILTAQAMHMNGYAEVPFNFFNMYTNLYNPKYVQLYRYPFIYNSMLKSLIYTTTPLSFKHADKSHIDNDKLIGRADWLQLLLSKSTVATYNVDRYYVSQPDDLYNVTIVQPLTSHMNINILNPPSKVGTLVNKITFDYRIVAPLRIHSLLALSDNTVIGKQNTGIHHLEESLAATMHGAIPLYYDTFVNSYELSFMSKYLQQHGITLYDYIMDYQYMPYVYTNTLPFGLNIGLSKSTIKKDNTDIIGIGDFEGHTITDPINYLFNPLYTIDNNKSSKESPYYHPLSNKIIYTHDFYSRNNMFTDYSNRLYHKISNNDRINMPSYFNMRNILLPVVNMDSIDNEAFIFTGKTQCLLPITYANVLRINDYCALSDRQLSSFSYLNKDLHVLMNTLTNNTLGISVRGYASESYTKKQTQLTLSNNFMNFYVNSLQSNALHTSYAVNKDNYLFDALKATSFSFRGSLNVDAYKNIIYKHQKPKYLPDHVVNKDVKQNTHLFSQIYLNDYTTGTYDTNIMLASELNKVRDNAHSVILNNAKYKLNTDIQKLVYDIINKKFDIATIKHSIVELLNKVNNATIDITKLFGLDIQPIYTPKCNNKNISTVSTNKTYFSSNMIIPPKLRINYANKYVAYLPEIHSINRKVVTCNVHKPALTSLLLFNEEVPYIGDFGVNIKPRTVSTSVEYTNNYIDFMQEDTEETYGFVTDRYNLFDNQLNTHRLSKGATLANGREALKYVHLLQQLVGDTSTLSMQVQEQILNNKGVIEGLYVAAAATLKDLYLNNIGNVKSTLPKYIKSRSLSGLNITEDHVIPSLQVKATIGADVSMLQNPETTTIGIDTDTFTKDKQLMKLAGVDVYYNNLLELRDIVADELNNLLATLEKLEYVGTENLITSIKSFINKYNNEAYIPDIDTLVLSSLLLTGSFLVDMSNQILSTYKARKHPNKQWEINNTIEILTSLYLNSSWSDLDATPAYEDDLVGSINKNTLYGYNSSVFPRVEEITTMGNDALFKTDLINTRYNTQHYTDIYSVLKEIRSDIKSYSTSKVTVEDYVRYVLKMYLNMIKLGGYSKGSNHINETVCSDKIITQTPVITNDSDKYVRHLPYLYKHFILLSLYGVTNVQSTFLTDVNFGDIIQGAYNIHNLEAYSDITKTNEESVNIVEQIIDIASKFMVLRYTNKDNEFVENPYIPTDDILSIHRYITLVNSEGADIEVDDIVKYVVNELSSINVVNISVHESATDTNPNKLFQEKIVKCSASTMHSLHVANYKKDNLDVLQGDSESFITMMDTNISVLSVLSGIISGKTFNKLFSTALNKILYGYDSNNTILIDYIIDNQYSILDQSDINDDGVFNVKIKFDKQKLETDRGTMLKGIKVPASVFRNHKDFLENITKNCINKSILTNMIKTNTIMALYEVHNINYDILETLPVTNSWLNVLIKSNLPADILSPNTVKTNYIYLDTTVQHTDRTIVKLHKQEFVDLVNKVKQTGSTNIRMLYTYSILKKHLVNINNINWVLNTAIQLGDSTKFLDNVKEIADKPNKYLKVFINNDTMDITLPFVNKLHTTLSILKNPYTYWTALATGNVGTTAGDRYDLHNNSGFNKMLSWGLYNDKLSTESGNVSAFTGTIDMSDNTIALGYNNAYSTHAIPNSLLNKYTGWQVRPSLISDSTQQYKITNIPELVEAVIKSKNLVKVPKVTKKVKKVTVKTTKNLISNTLLTHEVFNKSNNIPNWLVHIRSKNIETNLGKAFVPLLYKIKDYITVSSIQHTDNLPIKYYLDNVYTIAYERNNLDSIKLVTNEHLYDKNQNVTGIQFVNYNSPDYKRFNKSITLMLNNNLRSISSSINKVSLENIVGSIGYTYGEEAICKQSPLMQGKGALGVGVQKLSHLIAAYENKSPSVSVGVHSGSTGNSFRLKAVIQTTATNLMNIIEDFVGEIRSNIYKFEDFMEENKSIFTVKEQELLEIYNAVYIIMGFSMLIYTGLLEEYVLNYKVLQAVNAGTYTKLKLGISNKTYGEALKQLFSGMEEYFKISVDTASNTDITIDCNILKHVIDNPNATVDIAKTINGLTNEYLLNSRATVTNFVFQSLANKETIIDLAPKTKATLYDLYSKVQNIIKKHADQSDTLNSVLYSHSMYSYVNLQKYSTNFKDVLVQRLNKIGTTTIKLPKPYNSILSKELHKLGIPGDSYNLVYVYNRKSRQIYIGIYWYGMHFSTPALYLSFDEDILSIIIEHMDLDKFKKLIGISAINKVTPIQASSTNGLVSTIYNNPGKLIEYMQLETITPEYNYFNIADEFKDSIANKINSISILNNIDVSSIINEYATLCTPLKTAKSFYTRSSSYKDDTEVERTLKPFEELVKSIDDPICALDNNYAGNVMRSGVQMLPPLYKDVTNYIINVHNLDTCSIDYTISPRAGYNTYATGYSILLAKDVGIVHNSSILLSKLKPLIYTTKHLVYNGTVNLSEVVSGNVKMYNIDKNNLCNTHVFTIAHNTNELLNTIEQTVYKEYKDDDSMSSQFMLTSNIASSSVINKSEDYEVAAAILRCLYNMPPSSQYLTRQRNVSLLNNRNDYYKFKNNFENYIVNNQKDKLFAPINDLLDIKYDNFISNIMLNNPDSHLDSYKKLLDMYAGETMSYYATQSRDINMYNIYSAIYQIYNNYMSILTKNQNSIYYNKGDMDINFVLHMITSFYNKKDVTILNILMGE